MKGSWKENELHVIEPQLDRQKCSSVSEEELRRFQALGIVDLWGHHATFGIKLGNPLDMPKIRAFQDYSRTNPSDNSENTIKKVDSK